MRKLSLEDWILLLFYLSPNRMIKGELYVQEALFIASQLLERLRKMIEFEPYKYGPYCETVKDKLEVLERAGYIKRIGKRLLLMEDGLREILSKLNLFRKDEKEVLGKIIKFINQLDEDELLLYVYVAYGYYEKSDAINELLQKREEIALRMLKKGLISVGLASKIAGKPYLEFIELLKRKGIKPFRADENDLEEESANI